MNKQMAVIDTIGNGEFVLVDSKNKKSAILPNVVYQHYLKFDHKFTKNALDEIQSAIEDELLRKEESSAASYASTNAKILR
tara:strand:- start:38 stop:280 length:243 start_codon:yes stop_codon:yes gene_type:complete